MKILLSTAYLPPAEYFALIKEAEEIFIEREENYLKQSFRNRCYILSAGGPQILSVPVFLGSLHKTSVKEIRIDYSKRWQQVHLGAIRSAYSAAPFFIYYFEILEKIINNNYNYLLDLNMDLLHAMVDILKLKREIRYTNQFVPALGNDDDFRYTLSPKKKSVYHAKSYLQVFQVGKEAIQGLSIVDVIFNTGPDASHYL